MTTTSEETEAANPVPKASFSCVTCGADLYGQYCHNCGERVLEPNELRIRTFLVRSVGALFDLDSRLYHSFRLLLLRPGFLTAEYMAGRRRLYLNPLQIGIVAGSARARTPAVAVGESPDFATLLAR